jgi:hypothetical protein
LCLSVSRHGCIQQPAKARGHRRADQRSYQVAIGIGVEGSQPPGPVDGGGDFRRRDHGTIPVKAGHHISGPAGQDEVTFCAA